MYMRRKKISGLRAKNFISVSLVTQLFLILALTQPCLAGREYVPVDQLGMPSGIRTPQKSRSATRAHAPAAARSYISPSGAVKLFGTVQFQRPLNTLPGWLDVLKRNNASPIFIPEKYFNKSTTWSQLLNRASGKSPMEQMQIVNSFWNTWPYHDDMQNWGKEDYWAIPAQFLKKSGDCEDYAIVKYFTLKELGFDPQKMRIVVLRDTIRNLGHAVLVVYLDNEAWVLDNLGRGVRSHRAFSNYNPQYSVNEYGRWMHVKGKN